MFRPRSARTASTGSRLAFPLRARRSGPRCGDSTPRQFARRRPPTAREWLPRGVANQISFMTANYVARQTGYAMDGGWDQGDSTTQAHFRTLETFRHRFDDLLADIAGLGFEAIDLWSAHLHGNWATDAHIATARELLERHSLPVLSLGGGFGSSIEELDAFCRIANGVGCSILGGRTELLENERDRALDVLGRHGLRLA